jgi:hypothetical protein
MTSNEAFRDISSIMVELEHQNFMLELDNRNIEYAAGPGIKTGTERDTFQNDVICTECGVKRGRVEFKKIFQSGKAGICKKCWNYEDAP